MPDNGISRKFKCMFKEVRGKPQNFKIKSTATIKTLLGSGETFFKRTK